MSTSWINFDEPCCLTLSWFWATHKLSLSIESRRLFQSVIMQLLITALNSSIICGSIGFETEACRFLFGVDVWSFPLRKVCCMLLESENDTALKPSLPPALRGIALGVP
jgi:hypothetical protein